jgi:hypothetical protein
MKHLAALVTAFSLLSPRAFGDDGIVGRFQMMAGPPTVVIDTATGELWVFIRTEAGFAMYRVCYAGPTGNLSPWPIVDVSDEGDRPSSHNACRGGER